MDSAYQGIIALGVFLVFVLICDSAVIARMQKSLKTVQNRLAETYQSQKGRLPQQHKG